GECGMPLPQCLTHRSDARRRTVEPRIYGAAEANMSAGDADQQPAVTSHAIAGNEDAGIDHQRTAAVAGGLQAFGHGLGHRIVARYGEDAWSQLRHGGGPRIHRQYQPAAAEAT